MKEQASNERTLVVGLGNPLSGDDGFGAQVLDLLRQRETELLPVITLSDAHTDLLNAIEDFAAYDRVILIDAVLDPEGKLGGPGRVQIFREEAFLPWPEASHGVHQVSPLLGVKLFRLLHPEAGTQLTLVALLVDRIGQSPHFLTPESVKEGAAAVRSLVV